MARNTTLGKLLIDLRAETRRSLNAAHNVMERDTQVALLQRVQERLWSDFNWPHMVKEWSLHVQQGQRFYGVPADLDIERIERVSIFYDGCWQLLAPGIEDRHYSEINSELDERAGPAQRWRLVEDDDSADDHNIELWPIPDTDAKPATRDGYLKVVGVRTLRPLVDDDDRADLDDRLIVLQLAGEMLAAAGSKDAQLKLQQANQLYAKLRAGLVKTRRFQMFGTAAGVQHRRSYGRYVPPGA